jgi:hypothetical protein
MACGLTSPRTQVSSVQVSSVFPLLVGCAKPRALCAAQQRVWVRSTISFPFMWVSTHTLAHRLTAAKNREEDGANEVSYHACKHGALMYSTGRVLLLGLPSFQGWITNNPQWEHFVLPSPGQ